MQIVEGKDWLGRVYGAHWTPFQIFKNFPEQ